MPWSATLSGSGGSTVESSENTCSRLRCSCAVSGSLRAVVVVLDRVDEPMAVPDLGRHGQLAFDHGQNAGTVDRS